jgi:DNA mismatch repair ATPase MutL
MIPINSVFNRIRSVLEGQPQIHVPSQSQVTEIESKNTADIVKRTDSEPVAEENRQSQETGPEVSNGARHVPERVEEDVLEPNTNSITRQHDELGISEEPILDSLEPNTMSNSVPSKETQPSSIPLIFGPLQPKPEDSSFEPMSTYGYYSNHLQQDATQFQQQRQSQEYEEREPIHRIFGLKRKIFCWLVVVGFTLACIAGIVVGAVLGVKERNRLAEVASSFRSLRAMEKKTV